MGRDVMTLELHGARIGGLCAFGQTGIGWLAEHHCVFCAAYTMGWDDEA